MNVQLTKHVTAAVVREYCLMRMQAGKYLVTGTGADSSRRQAKLLNFETARGCVKVYFSNVNTQTVERAGLLAHSSEIPTGKTLYDVQSLLSADFTAAATQHAGVPSQLGSLPLSVVLK